MKRLLLVGIVLAASSAASPALQADLLSKKYLFKDAVILEMGVTTDDGVRLDTARFQLPSKLGGRVTRTGGVIGAEVAVSNTSADPRKVGLALALFDEEGRLLGVASGGSKLASIKPGRQKSFILIFDDVNMQAHRTTTFQVSMESK